MLAAAGGSEETASVYPTPLLALFLIVLLVATSVWIGGWFSLIVIARTTTATLSPQSRVAFFRHFGKVYGIASTVALVVALAFGLILLVGMPWTALSTWCAALSVFLIVVLIAGVLQARAQRRMRQQLIASPDQALQARTATGARAAAVLRAGLGVVSIAILVLAVVRMVS
ncbi:MAG TPA: hypothetical protein VFQ96_01260 [Microbacteriaceae bacterium]|nr:hypothetical protein [Microbacteriaceae bacterium]